MKILMLNPILYSGVDNFIPKVDTIKDTMIYSMCLGFKALGHQVTLLALECNKPTKEESYDFDILFFKKNFDRFLNAALPLSFSLNNYIRKNAKKFDLIISSEIFAFHSLCAARYAPKKTVIWQELTEHQRKLFRLPSLFWHNIIVKSFMRDVLAVAPRSTKAYEFVHRYLPQTSKIIVDHGIDVSKFKFSKEKKRQIISSSQLIYRKNVDGIIQKFEKLHALKGFEDIELIIAGRGDEEESLKALVQKLKLNKYVSFVGFLSQDKLNEYIRCSLCFLVNTRQDLNMVSIPESIVSGTPILTNLIPASAGYILQAKLGIAKNQWNEYDMKEIIENNSFYVENCLKYRNNLSSQHSAQLLIDLFKQSRYGTKS